MVTLHYYCPNCEEEYEEDYPDYCSCCGEKMPRRWADPVCGDCGNDLIWKRGGWYCKNCRDYPDDVDFEDEE